MIRQRMESSREGGTNGSGAIRMCLRHWRIDGRFRLGGLWHVLWKVASPFL